MAKIQSAAQSLTAPRDLTCAPFDSFFYYQIGHLGLQKLKPAKLAIDGHRFDVTSFAWQQPWGFSISCKNEHPNLEMLEKFVAGHEPIICRMKFVDRSIQCDCSLKAMRFDEQNIRLSFAGTGVISEKHGRQSRAASGQKCMVATTKPKTR